MKRVLVTGASGFCGVHLCRYLVDKGYKVTGTYHRNAVRNNIPGLSWVPLDMTHSASVSLLIQNLKPQGIFHLAGMSIPRFSWQHEKETFEINVGGTLYLLEALRRFSRQTKLLFVSSIQVYGRTFRKNQAVKESDLAWPESPYAVSKMVAEYACLDYAERFGIPVVIARPFNHIGRGQSLHFVFSEWCRQIVLAEQAKKKPVLEVGNLDSYRDFLNVQDVVKAYEILLRKGKPKTIYNICLGKTRLLREYVDFLLRKATVAIKVEVQKNRLRTYDPPVMKGSASRLRALGWKPELSPFQALQDLLEEWRSKVKNEK